MSRRLLHALVTVSKNWKQLCTLSLAVHVSAAFTRALTC